MRKRLEDLVVGDEVIREGESGFCEIGIQVVTDLSERTNERTKEVFKVIKTNYGQSFKVTDGLALTPPWGFRIRPLNKYHELDG